MSNNKRPSNMETNTAGATAAAVQNLIAAALAVALPAVTQQSITRPLNSAFQPSTAHDTIANYSVGITTTVLQAGSVALDIATDAGFSQNVQTIATVSFGSLAATVGLALGGVVPQSMWARLRTINTIGTPTFTYVCGQEASL